jgi:hypothetical protein
MSSKKKTPATLGTNLQALKIGSRVRCSDDGVEGRLIWANAVSVKIRWDDGEQVTWRRDSLAERPIEILDPAREVEQADGEQAVSTEATRAEPETAALPLDGTPREPSTPAEGSTG